MKELKWIHMLVITRIILNRYHCSIILLSLSSRDSHPHLSTPAPPGFPMLQSGSWRLLSSGPAWLARVWCWRQLCFVAEWAVPLRVKEEGGDSEEKGGVEGEKHTRDSWKKLENEKVKCKRRGVEIDKWVWRKGWGRNEREGARKRNDLSSSGEGR